MSEDPHTTDPDATTSTPFDASIGSTVERLYAELRVLASRKLARLQPGQTLSPTSLVHNVYERLKGKRTVNYASDHEFFIIAASSMRDILVERARHRATLKAGGNRRRVAFDELSIASAADDQTLLEFDELISRLRDQDETDYHLVMLRFYAGLTEEQAAEALSISLRSAQRRWQFVRARLFSWMKDASLNH